MKTNKLLVAAILAAAIGAPIAAFVEDLKVPESTTSPGVRVPLLHGLPTARIPQQPELASLERASEWLNSPPLTAPAYAQTPNINLIPELQSKSPEEKEQEAAKDKAYRESLKKIPDAKTSTDPWGNVRSADTPKPASPPKAKTKTGSSAN